MAAKKTQSKKAVKSAAVPFEEFEKKIGRAALPSAFVLAGAEEERRRQALALIKKRAEKIGGGLSLKEILCPQNPSEAASFLLADFFDHLRSPSLFGGFNLAVLRTADSVFKGTGAGAENLALVLRYLETPAANSCLIIELAASDARASVVKKLGKFAAVVACRSLYDKPAPWQRGAAPSDSELTGWIVAQAAEKFGKKISREAAYELAQMSGSSLARLSNELGKLALFLGDDKAEIETADIEKCAGHIRTHGLFTLIDAASERSIGLALATLQAMFERGVALGAGEAVTDSQGVAIILVSRLHHRFKQLAKARAMIDGGASMEMLRTAFKFRLEFQAQRLAEQAGRFSAGDFPARFEALLDADRMLKSTSNPPETVLQRLLICLCK